MMTITVEPMHNGFKHLMVSGAIALLAIGGDVTSGQSNVTGPAWARRNPDCRQAHELSRSADRQKQDVARRRICIAWRYRSQPAQAEAISVGR